MYILVSLNNILVFTMSSGYVSEITHKHLNVYAVSNNNKVSVLLKNGKIIITGNGNVNVRISDRENNICQDLNIIFSKENSKIEIIVHDRLFVVGLSEGVETINLLAHNINNMPRPDWRILTSFVSGALVGIASLISVAAYYNRK